MKRLLEDKFALYVIGIGLIARVIASAVIPPGFDEAYYGVYTMYPSWGYFDHPPMVTFTAGIGVWLFGTSSYLALRLGAVLLFVLSSWVLYETAVLLFNKRAAQISVLIFHITPFFLVGMGAFVIPDNALGLFWLVLLYSLAQIHITKNPRWFILGGIALGLALLAKYHAVLLIGCTGMALIFLKDWRKYLLTPYPYLALLIGIIIFIPNIIWNYNNDWISYAYQFGKGASGFDVSLTKFLQGVFVQAGYLLPWVMIVLLIAPFKLTNNYRVNWIYFFIFVPIGAFTLIGATRQILPHWPMPGYIAAIVICGYWISKWKSVWYKTFVWLTGGLTTIALVVILLQAITGFIPLELKADVTLDGQGWRQVVEELEAEGMLDENTFLFTHKWFTGGELAYAAGVGYTTTIFNEDDPHGFSFWVDDKGLIGKTGLFVSTNRYPADPVEMYSRYFTDIEVYGAIKTYRMGNEAQTFTIYKCTNLLEEYPYAYGGN